MAGGLNQYGYEGEEDDAYDDSCDGDDDDYVHDYYSRYGYDRPRRGVHSGVPANKVRFPSSVDDLTTAVDGMHLGKSGTRKDRERAKERRMEREREREKVREPRHWMIAVFNTKISETYFPRSPGRCVVVSLLDMPCLLMTFRSECLDMHMPGAREHLRESYKQLVEL